MIYLCIINQSLPLRQILGCKTTPPPPLTSGVASNKTLMAAPLASKGYVFKRDIG